VFIGRNSAAFQSNVQRWYSPSVTMNTGAEFLYWKLVNFFTRLNVFTLENSYITCIVITAKNHRSSWINKDVCLLSE
jgi:hypothetical protein